MPLPPKTHVTEPGTDQALELGLSACLEHEPKGAVGSEQGSKVHKPSGE